MPDEDESNYDKIVDILFDFSADLKNDKFIDKSIVLQKINKDLEFLYLKKNPRAVMNKTINPEIIKGYLNRYLTTSDKRELCKKLEIYNNRGDLYKWQTISKMLRNQGFLITDKSILINGTRTRVSIIHSR